MEKDLYDDEATVDKTTYLPMEDQINDCYAQLGLIKKNAHEMSEAEIDKAEKELEEFFEWVPEPGCAQLVPRCKASSIVTEDAWAKNNAEHCSNTEVIIVVNGGLVESVYATEHLDIEIYDKDDMSEVTENELDARTENMLTLL